MTAKEIAFLNDFKEILSKHDVFIEAVSDENSNSAWLRIGFMKWTKGGFHDVDYDYGIDRIDDYIDAGEIRKLLNKVQP